MGKVFLLKELDIIICPMEQTNREKLIRKVIVTYSVELGIFAALFAVLGALILSGVISVADWKRIAFSYVTMFGGLWLIIDFIWMLRSPKRRARNSMFDKIIVLPVGVAVLVFDIVMFALGLVHIPEGQATHPAFRFFIGADLVYLALVYIAEIIYHIKKPLPNLIQAVDQALKEEAEEAAKEEEAKALQEGQAQEEVPAPSEEVPLEEEKKDE